MCDDDALIRNRGKPPVRLTVMVTSSPKTVRKHLHASDLRGIAQLATQATQGVTRIAEGVHQSVWDSLGVRGGAAPGQTGGVTGLVYRGVRGAAQLLGRSADILLAKLEPSLAVGEAAAGSAQREAALAALNGVMGDYLVASGNPLALSMTMRYRGEALDWSASSQLPEATGKVLLLIHGLCLNDLQWRGHPAGRHADHGEALASTLGYTPVYLRYNSGLHTSHNGRELSSQIEHLVANWPTPIEELTVLAHSMGGLLARSAYHHAEQENLQWPTRLKNLVFLGTPHHGAPLERAGNWVDQVLGGTAYTAPFAMLGKLRSAGITDLRHGYVVDEDWQGHDRFHPKPDVRQIVPLPQGVACYTVAATAAAKRSATADRLIGDGLVPLHSALGQHDDARRDLQFNPASQWIAYRTNHMQLLRSPDVMQQLLRWLAPRHSA